MTNEEFRRYGHEVVDWMANYLENIRSYPVLPATQRGAVVDLLPAAAAEQGESMDAILEDFERTIVPRVTHWNHPRFLAYFATSASYPGILGEMLTAALNTQGMVWKSGPAQTELEQVTLDWLRQWMGLEPDFFGIIHDTASTATMHAIAAAREMADPESRTRGPSRDLVMYTSEQAHSSWEKGGITLGVGQENIRKIPVDEAFRMRVDVLLDAMESDRLAGRKPFCVIPTVGTTSTSSIVPVPQIAALAEEYGAWLHVDAAYGGAAGLGAGFRGVLDRARRRDSLVG